MLLKKRPYACTQIRLHSLYRNVWQSLSCILVFCLFVCLCECFELDVKKYNVTCPLSFVQIHSFAFIFPKLWMVLTLDLSMEKKHTHKKTTIDYSVWRTFLELYKNVKLDVNDFLLALVMTFFSSVKKWLNLTFIIITHL